MQEPEFKSRSDWSSYPVGKETWLFLKNKSFINTLLALLPLLWTAEAPPGSNKSVPKRPFLFQIPSVVYAHRATRNPLLPQTLPQDPSHQDGAER